MLGRIKPATLFVVAAVTAAIVACSDTTSPGGSGNPLKDLIRAGAGSGDTATTGGGGGGSTTGDGYFHGTVRGQSAPGATDTLNTAPRIGNVLVSVHSHVTTSTGDTLGVGPEVAHVTTDANGEFQTPVLPGALYIVTFTPPAGSAYQGVYAIATAYSRSADYPWYIVLPKR